LADTAYEDRGFRYLTRRCDVSQDVIVPRTIAARAKHLCRVDYRIGEIIEPLRDRIVGRVALEDQRDFEGS